ncbi:MAG: hypothetical protein FWG97_01360 [Deltaproteobacteria bacterium]|nr:hypothetical protein [Deltaproteobacteria bacterium]
MKPFCLAFAAALFLSGCLVKDDEFDEARQLKESLTAELVKLRQSNDHMNHEISRLYADREVLSGHVAMTAAVALHNSFTTRILPPPPPPPRPPQTPAVRPARPPQATAPPPPPGGAWPITPPPFPPGEAPRPRPSGAVDWGQ